MTDQDFPLTPLQLLVELMISGAWTDITRDVYERDSIRITRGRSDEGQAVDPGTCSLTLNNRLGKYSPRNPLSPLYGLIGRNTPIRVSALAGTPYLDVPPTPAVRVTTPDDPALTWSGDLDVRAELTAAAWDGAFQNGDWEIAGKWDQSAAPVQQSWLLAMSGNGALTLFWSPDGGADLLSSIATQSIPFGPGQRGAVRVTLDIDNGLGGYTVTFYSAPTIAGPWTQLSQDVNTTNGATLVGASTAALEVANISSVGFATNTARWHAFELRNGIDGTLVANPIFGDQAVGTTSFTDGPGRTWSISGGAAISNRIPRFVGEVPSWPLERDTSGQDVYVQLQAAGILRRLSKGVGSAPLQSTLRRRIPTDPSLLAYWPMEDGASAQQATSPITGVVPLRTSGFQYGQSDTLPGSSPLPTLDSQNGTVLPMMAGSVPGGAAAATNEFQVQFVYNQSTAPTVMRTFMRVQTSGSGEWYLQMDATGARVLVVDGDGNTLWDQTFNWGGSFNPPPFGDWYRMKFTCRQNGTGVDWQVEWLQVGATGIACFNTLPSATIGRVTTVMSPPNGYSPDLDGMAMGHIAVFSDADSTIFNGADSGFDGEAAGVRLTRLTGEEGTPLLVSPSADPMGPQLPETAMTLYQECADVDHGILYEDRDQLSLAYRSRFTLYNQTPASFAYLDLAPVLEPEDDDQNTQNDVTVQRTGGSSARVVQEDGPLSVEPPPAGVGPYSTSTTLNLATDDQPEMHAGWLVRLGTVDEARYPTVNFSLARTPELIDKVAALDCGDTFALTDPPVDFQADAIEQMVQGSTETLGPFQWDVAFNCTPASPYTIGVYDDSAARYDTAGSQLAAAATSTATTLTVATTVGPAWIRSAADPGTFPFDVQAGGERMTVTGITGLVEDTFGRTVTGGWGAADSGQVWTTSGGSASDYSVQGA